MLPSERSAPEIADRVAFVGGLHRSGTTPLAKWLATHPEISGLQNTGVQEDEGQHLQSVYEVARRHGGPGRFAFDPAARLTEESPLVSQAATESLVRAWAPYWDLSRHVLLEKSPPNLLRMRFLRALFPHAPFIMVVRHPIAVAMATRKWSRTSTRSLVDHWVRAHANLAADARSVGRVAVVRYEDLMASPEAMLSALFRFLGVSPCDGSWIVSSGLNGRYFEQFRAESGSLSGRIRTISIRRHGAAIARFGYRLDELEALDEPGEEVRALDPRRTL